MSYLVAALVVVWLLVTVYVVYMSMRQRQLENEIRTLEEVIEENDRG